MSRHLHARSQLDFNFPDILPDWILQPQDLNTIGIDPIGREETFIFTIASFFLVGQIRKYEIIVFYMLLIKCTCATDTVSN